jgi:MFS transporter, FHS family, Na+ dependent glucose transporter 1
MPSAAAVCTSAAYSATQLAMGLVLASLGPVMLALTAQTAASVDELAVIFSARALGHVGGCIIGGWLLDKLRGGGHRLMVASLLALSACTALQPMTRSVGALACLTALQGVGMGFLDPCCNVLLLWLHGSRSAPWMQAMHCCFGVGALLSPLLVRAAQAASATRSYHSAFYGIAGFLLAAALPFLLLPSPPPPAHRVSPASAIWRGCCSRSLRDVLRLLLADAALLVTLVATILGIYVGAEVSYGAYVLVYAHQELDISEGNGQFITAVFWGCLALGRLAAMFIAMRMPPVRMLWIAFTGCCACALVLLALPSVRVIWAASAVLGFCMAPVFPTLYSLAGSYMSVSGRVATVFVIGASAGVSIRPTASCRKHTKPTQLVFRSWFSLLQQGISSTPLGLTRSQRWYFAVPSPTSACSNPCCYTASACSKRWSTKAQISVARKGKCRA